MIPDVTSAKYVDSYRISVEFEDGQRGIADFGAVIAAGGVFAALADQERFRQFKVNPELGVLTWGDNVDIAPETLYSLATGAPLPEWMRPAQAWIEAHPQNAEVLREEQPPYRVPDRHQ